MNAQQQLIYDMKMSKVGNQTNSNDPQAVNSRVFVGNLNTYQVTKDDVERMFKRYGRLVGISMHKGYAFVQFTNPYEARTAVQSEDGAVICGQTLDVNMVAEPKDHQTGRKRQNVANTGNDWDYYYDSYSVGPQRMTPPMKRARIGGGLGGPQRPKGKAGKPAKLQPIPYNQLNTYTTPDILICGNCKENFGSLQKLVEHKKTKCKLRFASNEPSALICSLCKERFVQCWDLVSHVQTVHNMAIYEVPPELVQADELKQMEMKKEDEGMSDNNNTDLHGEDNGDEGEQDGDPVDEDVLLNEDGGEGDESQDS